MQMRISQRNIQKLRELYPAHVLPQPSGPISLAETVSRARACVAAGACMRDAGAAALKARARGFYR